MCAEKPNTPKKIDSNRTLSLKSSGVNLGVTSNFVRGKGKTVEVEVKKSRGVTSRPTEKTPTTDNLKSRISRNMTSSFSPTRKPSSEEKVAKESEVSYQEQDEQRSRAEKAKKALEALKQQQQEENKTVNELELARRQLDEKAQKEQEESENLRRQQEDKEKQRAEEVSLEKKEKQNTPTTSTMTTLKAKGPRVSEESFEVKKEREEPARPEKRPRAPRGEDERRRQGKLTIAQALSADGDTYNRSRSVAALRRQRDKERARAIEQRDRQEKVVREVIIPETIQVGDLANRMAVRGADLIKHLFQNGMVMKMNDYLDADTAQLLVEEFGHSPVRVSESDVEDSLLPDDEQGEKKPRSPVVTVMGHVDHGKTTLLDTLRKARVAAGEAGGITQHIAAYRVPVNKNQTITFLDTPGHEAFSEMRSRGAKATDIVVLVVAANDSVLPQTIEAINHARAAAVPIIVAINKCDLPDVDPQKVRLDLLNHNVIGEENGGDTLMVEISALKGDGLDTLLDTILLQAELLELKASADGRARGVVIEARQEVGRGVVATVLVQSGQLHKGDIFVAGHEWGRVKMQYDDQGKIIKSAGPSTPVEIQGLQGVVGAGDEFTVLAEESQARDIAEYRQRKMNEARLASANRNSIEQMFQNISERSVNELKIVLRTDVLGSSEAIIQALQKISNEEVTVHVIHSGIGAVTESDITLAKSSEALVVGFNVRANAPAREMAKREGMSLRYFSIIYELIDDIRALASGLLAPEEREVFLGYAEIRQVFNLSKGGMIAGCMVTEGVVRRGAEVRLLREDVVMHRGKLSQLRRFKDDVQEVRNNMECGMSFENHNDLKEGDRIECFEVVQEQRQL